MAAGANVLIESSVATAELCCLTGPEHGKASCEHWRAFDRKIMLARLRHNLEELASTVAFELLVECTQLTAEMLSDAMLMRIGNAVSRSKIVPWHLPDSVLERVARMVARRVAEEVRQ